MATEIGICNSALLKLGADRITSLSENRRPAILCNEQYPKMRQEVLADHPWNFALKRVELATLDTTPAFEFDYALQLPADCLRVLKLDHPTLDFRVEGRSLLVNETSVNIKYIYDVTDASVFSPLFAEALAARLAADLAYPLVQSNTLHEQMMVYYEKLLRKAKAADAQEGKAEPLMYNTFLNARL